jgi:formylglycine-generating enzyme required for sulfatase activity/predicted Ser/Thr protein kinase
MHDDLPKIEGYAVEGLLGSGGMSTVYRGRQLGLDRPVAIKLLRAYGPDAEELRRRFEQEAKLIAVLDHPHIVAIYEVTHTAAGEACYVMPLFTHGDLASRPRPMAEDEIRRVLTQVLEALGHAHAHGVVHRDVKPENVLFDARGKALLADFGVAITTSRQTRLTQAGRTVGSSHTMSPEQARGEVVDGRSDLYSVGCMAYELLVGTPPFDGPDFLSIALKHQQDPVPRLPSGQAHWQAFFDRALAKRPEDRFPDAAAMVAALQTTAAGEPRRPAPAVAGARARRRPAAIALIALIPLLAALAWWLLSRMPPPDSAAAPTASPVASALAEPIKRAIAAGDWFGERPDSASSLLIAAFASEPVDAPVIDLRDLLLDAVRQRHAESPFEELAGLLPAWRRLVDATRASATPAVREMVAILERRLEQPLAEAHRARDRALAGQALALAQALPDPSPAFAERLAELARFPATGEPFRDADGPELLLIAGGRLQGFSKPFAVTRYEITRGEFAAFVSATGHRTAACRERGQTLDWRAPGFAQQANEPVVCVSYEDAAAYAAWLSTRSGRSYRLPTLAEWQALAARGGDCGNLEGRREACGDGFRETAPVGRLAAPEGWPADLVGNVREWTQSCEFREIGAVRRTIANFGRLLQGKERDASGRVCIGRYVAGSGWRDASAMRTASVADEDSAAADRGFRLVREIR